MEFKAGMEKVDLEAMNETLKKLSVGSRYQAKLDSDDKKMMKYIEETLTKMNDIDVYDPEYQKKVDDYLDVLCADKVIDRVFIHIDMDAFYASVEELDFPHLRGKPVAVGTNDMLVTSNYVARQYGIRAGVPGSFCINFCPELIIQPSRMDRYREISEIIQQLFIKYDPHYVCPSLDEACLEITQYLVDHPDMTPVDVAGALQGDIVDTTTLTSSMGIAYSPMLAKVCSEVNKPNGYYYLEPNYDNCLEFISSLPVKKIPGIGKVRQQLLITMGLSTISEVYESRYELYHILQDSKDILFKHVLAIPIFPKPKSFKVQKKKRSISKEASCKELYNRNGLIELSKQLYDNLINQLKTGNYYATTMVVKVQNYSFNATYHSFKLFDTTTNIQEYFDQKTLQKSPQQHYYGYNSFDETIHHNDDDNDDQHQEITKPSLSTSPPSSPRSFSSNLSESSSTTTSSSNNNNNTPTKSPKSPSIKTPKAKREYLIHLLNNTDFNQFSEKIWNNFIKIINETVFEDVRCIGLQLVNLITTSPTTTSTVLIDDDEEDNIDDKFKSYINNNLNENNISLSSSPIS